MQVYIAVLFLMTCHLSTRYSDDCFQQIYIKLFLVYFYFYTAVAECSCLRVNIDLATRDFKMILHGMLGTQRMSALMHVCVYLHIVCTQKI